MSSKDKKRYDPSTEPEEEFDEEQFLNSLDSEDSDLDGFSVGFEDLDSDEDRSPVTKDKQVTGVLNDVGKSAAAGAAIGMASKIGDVVPNVGRAANSALNVVSDITRMKDETIQEMGPIWTQMKTGLRKLAPFGKDLVPDSIYNKIMNKLSAEEDTHKGPDKREERNNAITRELDTIFGAQEAQRQEERKQDAVREMFNDRIMASRHREMAGLSLDTRNQMIFQTQFIRGTFTNWLRKKLEIDYRRLYLAEDQLEASRITAQMLEKKLDAIRHNTALPDYAKIKLSEVVQKKIGEQLVGKWGDQVSNYVAGGLARIKNQWIDPIKDMFGTIADMGGSFADMLIAGEEMGEKFDARKSLMRSLGSGMGGLVGAIGGRKVINMLPKNLLMALNEGTGSLDTRLIGIIERIKKGELRFRGSGFASSILGAITPDVDTSAGSTKNLDWLKQDEAGHISKRFVNTVEKVIPSYLSLQTKYLAAIAGDKEGAKEQLTWDWQRGELVRDSVMAQRIQDRAFGTEEERNRWASANYEAIVSGATTGLDEDDNPERKEKRKEYLKRLGVAQEANKRDLALIIENLARSRTYAFINEKSLVTYVRDDIADEWVDVAIRGVKNPKAAMQTLFNSLCIRPGEIDRGLSWRLTNYIGTKSKQVDKHQDILEQALREGYGRVLTNSGFVKLSDDGDKYRYSDNMFQTALDKVQAENIVKLDPEKYDSMGNLKAAKTDAEKAVDWAKSTFKGGSKWLRSKAKELSDELGISEAFAEVTGEWKAATAGLRKDLKRVKAMARKFKKDLKDAAFTEIYEMMLDRGTDGAVLAHALFQPTKSHRPRDAKDVPVEVLVALAVNSTLSDFFRGLANPGTDIVGWFVASFLPDDFTDLINEMSEEQAQKIIEQNYINQFRAEQQRRRDEIRAFNRGKKRDEIIARQVKQARENGMEGTDEEIWQKIRTRVSDGSANRRRRARRDNIKKKEEEKYAQLDPKVAEKIVRELNYAHYGMAQENGRVRTSEEILREYAQKGILNEKNIEVLFNDEHLRARHNLRDKTFNDKILDSRASYVAATLAEHPKELERLKSELADIRAGKEQTFSLGVQRIIRNAMLEAGYKKSELTHENMLAIVESTGFSEDNKINHRLLNSYRNIVSAEVDKRKLAESQKGSPRSGFYNSESAKQTRIDTYSQLGLFGAITYGQGKTTNFNKDMRRYVNEVLGEKLAPDSTKRIAQLDRLTDNQLQELWQLSDFYAYNSRNDTVDARKLRKELSDDILRLADQVGEKEAGPLYKKIAQYVSKCVGDTVLADPTDITDALSQLSPTQLSKLREIVPRHTRQQFDTWARTVGARELVSYEQYISNPVKWDKEMAQHYSDTEKSKVAAAKASADIRDKHKSGIANNLLSEKERKALEEKQKEEERQRALEEADAKAKATRIARMRAEKAEEARIYTNLQDIGNAQLNVQRQMLNVMLNVGVRTVVVPTQDRTQMLKLKPVTELEINKFMPDWKKFVSKSSKLDTANRKASAAWNKRRFAETHPDAAAFLDRQERYKQEREAAQRERVAKRPSTKITAEQIQHSRWAMTEQDGTVNKSRYSVEHKRYQLGTFLESKLENPWPGKFARQLAAAVIAGERNYRNQEPLSNRQLKKEVDRTALDRTTLVNKLKYISEADLDSLLLYTKRHQKHFLTFRDSFRNDNAKPRVALAHGGTIDDKGRKIGAVPNQTLGGEPIGLVNKPSLMMNGRALVGERGPETVVPLNRSPAAREAYLQAKAYHEGRAFAEGGQPTTDGKDEHYANPSVSRDQLLTGLTKSLNNDKSGNIGQSIREQMIQRGLMGQDDKWDNKSLVKLLSRDDIPQSDVQSIAATVLRGGTVDESAGPQVNVSDQSRRPRSAIGKFFNFFTKSKEQRKADRLKKEEERAGVVDEMLNAVRAPDWGNIFGDYGDYTEGDSLTLERRQLQMQMKMVELMHTGVKVKGAVVLPSAVGAMLKNAAGSVVDTTKSLFGMVGNVVKTVAWTIPKEVITRAVEVGAPLVGHLLELAGKGVGAIAKRLPGLGKTALKGLRKVGQLAVSPFTATKAALKPFVDIYVRIPTVQNDTTDEKDGKGKTTSEQNAKQYEISPEPIVTASAQRAGLIANIAGEVPHDSYHITEPMYWTNDAANGSRAGDCAITQEQIERGLVDKNGVPLSRLANRFGGTARRAANFLGRNAARVAKAIGGAATALTAGIAGTALWAGRTALRIAKTGGKALITAKNPFIDVYVPDELGRFKVGSPRLTGQGIKDHEYYYADGKPVTSAYGIEEPVFDRTGKTTLISEEDLKRGLVDASGNRLTKFRGRSILGKMTIGAAGVALKTAFKLGKGALRLGKWATAGLVRKVMGAVRGAADLGGTIIDNMRTFFLEALGTVTKFGGVNRTDLEEIVGNRLLDIYGLLHQRLPIPAKDVAADANNDGVRDGSYEDYLKRRQARAEKKSRDAELAKKRREMEIKVKAAEDKAATAAKPEQKSAVKSFLESIFGTKAVAIGEGAVDVAQEAAEGVSDAMDAIGSISDNIGTVREKMGGWIGVFKKRSAPAAESIRNKLGKAAANARAEADKKQSMVSSIVASALEKVSGAADAASAILGGDGDAIDAAEQRADVLARIRSLLTTGKGQQSKANKLMQILRNEDGCSQYVAKASTKKISRLLKSMELLMAEQPDAFDSVTRKFFAAIRYNYQPSGTTTQGNTSAKASTQQSTATASTTATPKNASTLQRFKDAATDAVASAGARVQSVVNDLTAAAAGRRATKDAPAMTTAARSGDETSSLRERMAMGLEEGKELGILAYGSLNSEIADTKELVARLHKFLVSANRDPRRRRGAAIALREAASYTFGAEVVAKLNYTNLSANRSALSAIAREHPDDFTDFYNEVLRKAKISYRDLTMVDGKIYKGDDPTFIRDRQRQNTLTMARNEKRTELRELANHNKLTTKALLEGFQAETAVIRESMGTQTQSVLQYLGILGSLIGGVGGDALSAAADMASTIDPDLFHRNPNRPMGKWGRRAAAVKNGVTRGASTAWNWTKGKVGTAASWLNTKLIRPVVGKVSQWALRGALFGMTKLAPLIASNPVGWAVGAVAAVTLVAGTTAYMLLKDSDRTKKFKEQRYKAYGISTSFDNAVDTIEDLEERVLEVLDGEEDDLDRDELIELAEDLGLVDDFDELSSTKRDDVLKYLNRWYCFRFRPIYQCYVMGTRDAMQLEPDDKDAEPDVDAVKDELVDPLYKRLGELYRKVTSAPSINRLLPTKMGLLSYINSEAKRKGDDLQSRQRKLMANKLGVDDKVINELNANLQKAKESTTLIRMSDKQKELLRRWGVSVNGLDMNLTHLNNASGNIDFESLRNISYALTSAAMAGGANPMAITAAENAGMPVSESGQLRNTLKQKIWAAVGFPNGRAPVGILDDVTDYASTVLEVLNAEEGAHLTKESVEELTDDLGMFDKDNLGYQEKQARINYVAIWITQRFIPVVLAWVLMVQELRNDDEPIEDFTPDVLSLNELRVVAMRFDASVKPYVSKETISVLVPTPQGFDDWLKYLIKKCPHKTRDGAVKWLVKVTKLPEVVAYQLLDENGFKEEGEKSYTNDQGQIDLKKLVEGTEYEGKEEVEVDELSESAQRAVRQHADVLTRAGALKFNENGEMVLNLKVDTATLARIAADPEAWAEDVGLVDPDNPFVLMFKHKADGRLVKDKSPDEMRLAFYGIPMKNVASVSPSVMAMGGPTGAHAAAQQVADELDADPLVATVYALEKEVRRGLEESLNSNAPVLDNRQLAQWGQKFGIIRGDKGFSNEEIEAMTQQANDLQGASSMEKFEAIAEESTLRYYFFAAWFFDRFSPMFRIYLQVASTYAKNPEAVLNSNNIPKDKWPQMLKVLQPFLLRILNRKSLMDEVPVKWLAPTEEAFQRFQTNYKKLLEQMEKKKQAEAERQKRLDAKKKAAAAAEQRALDSITSNRDADEDLEASRKRLEEGRTKADQSTVTLKQRLEEQRRKNAERNQLVKALEQQRQQERSDPAADAVKSNPRVTTPAPGGGGMPMLVNAANNGGMPPSVNPTTGHIPTIDLTKLSALPIPDGGTGDLGAYVRQFESGPQGSAAIGWDSTGGTSYGTYQIATKTGTMQAFLKYAEEKGGEFGKEVAAALRAVGDLNTGGRKGPGPTTWKNLAKVNNGESLHKLETGFIHESHYLPALNGIADPQAKALIESDRGLREALWSTAVQHGPSASKGAAAIFNRTYRPGISAAEWLAAIYQKRGRQFGSSTPDVQQSVLNRYKRELPIVLGLSQTSAATSPAGDGTAEGATDGTNETANDASSSGATSGAGDAASSPASASSPAAGDATTPASGQTGDATNTTNSNNLPSNSANPLNASNPKLAQSFDDAITNSPATTPPTSSTSSSSPIAPTDGSATNNSIETQLTAPRTDMVTDTPGRTGKVGDPITVDASLEEMRSLHQTVKLILDAVRGKTSAPTTATESSASATAVTTAPASVESSPSSTAESVLKLINFLQETLGPQGSIADLVRVLQEQVTTNNSNSNSGKNHNNHNTNFRVPVDISKHDFDTPFDHSFT